MPSKPPTNESMNHQPLPTGKLSSRPSAVNHTNWANIPNLKTFVLAVSSVILVWVPVLLLHLTLVLFATLITYALIRGIAGWIHRHVIAYLSAGEIS